MKAVKCWGAQACCVQAFLVFLALSSAAYEQPAAAVVFSLVTPLQSRNELYSLFEREKLWCRNSDTSCLILAARKSNLQTQAGKPQSLQKGRNKFLNWFLHLISFLPISE